MAFNINGSTPPAYARPTAPKSKLSMPKPTGFDGNGLPCGAVGKPEYMAYRNYMSAAGHAWWMNFFSDPDDLSVAVTNITIYNPYAEQEQTYASGKMLRPEWAAENPGVWYQGYTVRFVELVE